MRIWFNQGFSLAAIARAMMAADPALEVCVSVGVGKPVHDGPTQTFIEPDSTGPAGSGEGYLDWVRQMVRDNGVDVLVPTRHRQLLASADVGCRVECAGSADVLALLDDKCAFAQALAGEPWHLPTQSADSVADLRTLVAGFRAAQPDGAPCVKPQVGVNGHGFWRLTRGGPLTHLMNPDARFIQEDLYFAALERAEAEGPIAPLVLMDFLPGPEVSIDVLAHRGAALHALARTKHAASQRVQSAHPLVPLAGDLVERFGLHGLVNIQFRRARDDSWKVLEINPRAAGGAVYADPFGGRLVADWGGLISGRLTPEAVDRSPLDITLAFTQTLALVDQGPQP